jgi:hypothetical protein
MVILEIHPVKVNQNIAGFFDVKRIEALRT